MLSVDGSSKINESEEGIILEGTVGQHISGLEVQLEEWQQLGRI